MMKEIVGIEKKLLVSLFVALFLISGCISQKPTVEPIRIGVNTFPGYAHAFIAKEKGFFEKNGANVELIAAPDYLSMQKQFLDGEVDGNFMVYADDIYAADAGIPIKVVYISDYSIQADAIVAKPEIKNLQDLKGKVIGVEGINSFSHLFVLSVLEKNGIKEGDVFIQNVAAQDVVEAIEKEEIVAGHTYGQGLTQSGEKGYTQLAYAGDVKGIITDTLVFHEQMIKDRPKEIRAIVKSLFEAQEFQRTHREEALQIMAAAVGDTLESVGKGIDALDILNAERNAQAMQKSEDLTNLYGSGKLIADFWIGRGQISKEPDFDRLIDSSFVRQAMQEDNS